MVAGVATISRIHDPSFAAIVLNFCPGSKGIADANPGVSDSPKTLAVTVPPTRWQVAWLYESGPDTPRSPWTTHPGILLSKLSGVTVDVDSVDGAEPQAVSIVLRVANKTPESKLRTAGTVAVRGRGRCPIPRQLDLTHSAANVRGQTSGSAEIQARGMGRCAGRSESDHLASGRLSGGGRGHNARAPEGSPNGEELGGSRDVGGPVMGQ